MSRTGRSSNHLVEEVPGYVMQERIARGGFSTVLRAIDPLQRDVAVKVLDMPLSDERAEQSFADECNAVAVLGDHPRVVPVLDHGRTTSGHAYLAMPYLSGGSLQDAVDRGERLSAPEAARIGIELASALASAHARGLVHRDVKPGNVLRSGFGDTFLCDWGVAIIAEDPRRAMTVAALTPVHAAPEVLDGERAGPAADVYALASTLFTLLHGRPPLTGPDDGPASQTARKLRREPVEIPPCDPEVAAVTEVLASVLDAEVGERPDSVRFAEQLQQAQRAHAWPVTTLQVASAESEPSAVIPGPAGGPATVLGEAPAQVGRRRRRVAVAAVLAALTGVGSAAWLARDGAPQQVDAAQSGLPTAAEPSSDPESAAPTTLAELPVNEELGRPRGVLARANADGTVTVRWSSPGTGERGVRGYRLVNVGTGEVREVLTGATYAFVFGGLEPGESYTFRVATLGADQTRGPWVETGEVVAR